MPHTVDVSVILPVHNTMPDLESCLNSLVNQNIGSYRHEVVAVDDGSTDGSGELLDEFAARHPNIRVIHQGNSGWPGQPRNAGIAASNGRYVFFADADDELGTDSLRRQVAFADRHSSDVIVPKIVINGRAMGNVWSASRVDADLVTVFRSLSPQKMFRRTFLDAHGIRFPEGMVPLEDGILLARAYLLADRVSILADYDHYLKHDRDSGENISLRGKQPAPYAASVSRIIDIVREHAPDDATADEIVLDVYRRKALKFLTPHRFNNYRQWRRKSWVAEISTILDTRIPAELEARLPLEARLRSMAARSGDASVVLAVVQALVGNGVRAEFHDQRVRAVIPTAPAPTTTDVTDDVSLTAQLGATRPTEDGYEFDIEVDTTPLALADPRVELVVTGLPRDKPHAVVPLDRGTAPPNASARFSVSGILPHSALTSCVVQRHTPWLRVVADTAVVPMPPVRIHTGTLVPDRFPITTGRRTRPYATTAGTLAILTGPATLTHTVAERSRDARELRAWLRRQRDRVLRKVRRRTTLL